MPQARGMPRAPRRGSPESARVDDRAAFEAVRREQGAEPDAVLVCDRPEGVAGGHHPRRRGCRRHLRRGRRSVGHGRGCLTSGRRQGDAVTGVDDARPVEPVPGEHIGGGEAPACGDRADRVAVGDNFLARRGVQGTGRRDRRRYRDGEAQRAVRVGRAGRGGGRCRRERQRHRADQSGRGGDAETDACRCRSQESPPSFDPATVSRNVSGVNGGDQRGGSDVCDVCAFPPPRAAPREGAIVEG